MSHAGIPTACAAARVWHCLRRLASKRSSARSAAVNDRTHTRHSSSQPAPQRPQQHARRKKHSGWSHAPLSGRLPRPALAKPSRKTRGFIGRAYKGARAQRSPLCPIARASPEEEGARNEQRRATGVTGGRPSGRRVGHEWSGGGEGTSRSGSRCYSSLRYRQLGRCGVPKKPEL